MTKGFIAGLLSNTNRRLNQSRAWTFQSGFRNLSGMLVDLQELCGALKKDEIVPCFQPLAELRAGKLAGFEVLARWQHPVNGLILPANFISLAEENGLLGRLMQQVLRKALQVGVALPAPLVLAVNVSAAQLHDLTLPAQIRAAAEEAGYPLDRLTIEITETALVDNLEHAQTIARKLKDLGCRLALDDFGTGYSGLQHLQALPFDELKIDQSFVRSMTHARDSRKIVAATVGLGLSLGMITVAEGVETEEQADMLLRLGCELGQGWLYGKALPAEALPAMLAAAPKTLSTKLTSPEGDWTLSSLEARPAQRLAQLQAIYDGAPVSLCFLDRTLRYVSLNRRLADLNGPSIVAHLGKTVEEMIPAAYPRIVEYLQRALAGESITEVEVRRPPTKPGDIERTMLISYQPARDEAEEVIGVSVALVDITERRRAEEALQESQAHHRNAVELNPHMPWVTDAEGNLLEISTRWLQLTGMSAEDVRGEGWLQALHPEDLDAATEAMSDARCLRTPFDVEFRVLSADGQWRWMRSWGAPRHDAASQLMTWYGSIEDISDRKQLQEALSSAQWKIRALEQHLASVTRGLSVANRGRITGLPI